MSEGRVIRARIVAIKRLRNSANGNPRAILTLADDDGWLARRQLQDDASFGYAMENPEYRDELHDFHMTAAGRIAYATRVA